MKTLIGVNILTSINSLAYANHCQFWYRLAKEYPSHEFIFMTPPRMTIDRMRNESARIAMEQSCDYLMFIDDDVLVPMNAYTDLLKMDYDIAAGFVVIRGYPYDVMFFKEEYINGRISLPRFNDYEKFVKGDGIVDCGAVGFSCVLIKVELLKSMRPPYFVSGTRNTEDIYFCVRTKKEIEGVKIGVQTKIKCGHIGTPRVFTFENRLLYKEFDEKEDTGLVRIESYIDHGESYLEKCLASMELT